MTNSLSVIDHFVGFALKGLVVSVSSLKCSENAVFPIRLDGNIEKVFLYTENMSVLVIFGRCRFL